MILRGPTKARTFVPLPQERPEASTDKAIDVAKRRASRVFEVPKPPPEERLECGNDLRQAPAARPTCVLPDPVPQPLQTLGTHVPPSPSKAVAQKVKALASLAAIDNPGFLRMESQPMLCHPSLDQGQGGLGVGWRAAQEDEIVTVADDHRAGVGHDAIQGMSIQIRQQRTQT